MNNLMTASRQTTLMMCPRAHYWAYEVGLRKVETGTALRIGSAWHRAMEALAKGKPYDGALEAAYDTGAEKLDELEAGTIAGLLLGYYKQWVHSGFYEHEPEKEFKLPLFGIKDWEVAGKIDNLTKVGIDSCILTEHKTTKSELKPDSEYWDRLKFNVQIFQYVLAARALGYDPDLVVYDVTRKPSIKPKMIADRDKDGLKIVLQPVGQVRVFLKNGKPKQTAGEGEVLKEHRESASEFCQRLYLDTQERPEFYFARREVPILEDLLVEFQHHRIALVWQVRHMRETQKRMPSPEMAWTRNVSDRTCKFCQYRSFCLQNIKPTLASPPDGFRFGKFNPELTVTTEEDDTSST